MSEPQTEAGKALLADLVPAPRGHEATCHECLALLHEEREAEGTRIAAIEKQARDAALAEAEAAVHEALLNAGPRWRKVEIGHAEDAAAEAIAALRSGGAGC